MIIEKTNEIKSPYINMLVYGVSGIGKTVFASTAPKPLFLDAEAGLLSIKDKDVDFITIKEWSDIQKVYEDLLCKKIKGYETIILDSLTEISRKSMDAILTAQNGNGMVRKDVPNQHDWLRNIEQTRRLVRCFRDLPFHIIFTCLSKDTLNDMSGGVVRKPSVSSKSLSDDIPGYVDLVGYMDIDKEGARWLLVQPYRTTQGFDVYAKHRGSQLEKFEKPDFKALLKKIYASKPKAAKTTAKATPVVENVNKNKEVK